MALPGSTPTIQIAITYDPGTGLAISNIGSDLNKVASTVEQANTRLANSLQTSVATLSRTAINTGIVAFAAFSAAVSTGAVALERLGKGFITVNENFANLEIGLKSALRSVEAAKAVRNEIANITAVSFLPFQGLADIARFMATTPTLRVQMQQSATQGTLNDPNGPLRQMVSMVEQMRVFRPDREVSDAIFSIRAMMAGNMQSLIRRFSLPPQLLPAYAPPEANIRDVKDLRANPQAALAAFRNLMNSLITPDALNEFLRQPKVLIQNFFEQIFQIPVLRIGDSGIYNKILSYFFGLYQKTVTFIDEGFNKYVERIGKGLSGIFDTLTHYGERFAEQILRLAGYGQIQFPTLSFADRFMTALRDAIEYAATNLPAFLDKLLATFETIAGVVKQLGAVFSSLIGLFTTSFNTSPWMTIIGGIAALKLLPNVIAQSFGALQRGLLSSLGGGAVASVAGMGAANAITTGTPSIFNPSALRGAPRDIQQYLQFRTPGTGSGLTAPAYYLTSDAPDEFFSVAGKTRPAGTGLTQIKASSAEKIFGNQVTGAAGPAATAATGGMFAGLITSIGAAVLAFAAVTIVIAGVTAAFKALSDEQERRRTAFASNAQQVLGGQKAIFTGVDQDQYTWNPFSDMFGGKSPITGNNKQFALRKYLPESFQDQTTFTLKESAEAIQSRLEAFQDFFRRTDELKQAYPNKFDETATSFIKNYSTTVAKLSEDFQAARDYVQAGRTESDFKLPSGRILKTQQDVFRFLNEESDASRALQGTLEKFSTEISGNIGKTVPIIFRGNAEAQKALDAALSGSIGAFLPNYKSSATGGAIANQIQNLEDLRKTASYTAELDAVRKKYETISNPGGGISQAGEEIDQHIKDALKSSHTMVEAIGEITKNEKTALETVNSDWAKLKADYGNAPDSLDIKGTSLDREEFRKAGITNLGQLRKNLQDNQKRLTDALSGANSDIVDEAKKLLEANMLIITETFGDKFAQLISLLEIAFQQAGKAKMSNESPIAQKLGEQLQNTVAGLANAAGLKVPTPTGEEFTNAIFAKAGANATEKGVTQEQASQWLMENIMQPFLQAITAQMPADQAERVKAAFQPLFTTFTSGIYDEGKAAVDTETEKFKNFLRTREESFVAGVSGNLVSGGPNANALALQRYTEAQGVLPGLQGVNLNSAPFLKNTMFMGDAAQDVQIERLKALVDFTSQLTKAYQDQTLKLAGNSPERQKLITDIDKLRIETASYRDQLLSLESPGMFTSFLQGLAQSVNISINSLNNLRTAGQQLGDALKTGLGTAFDEFLTGAKSAGQAFRDFGTSILQTAAKIASQQAANALIGILFSVLGSVAGGAIGGPYGAAISALFSIGGKAATSGASTGSMADSWQYNAYSGSSSSGTSTGNNGVYNSTGELNVDLPPGGALGGKVVGGSGIVDDVHMRLMKGEFIVNKTGVAALGEQVLHAANKGSLRQSSSKAGSLSDPWGALPPPIDPSNYGNSPLSNPPSISVYPGGDAGPIVQAWGNNRTGGIVNVNAGDNSHDSAFAGVNATGEIDPQVEVPTDPYSAPYGGGIRHSGMPYSDPSVNFNTSPIYQRVQPSGFVFPVVTTPYGSSDVWGGGGTPTDSHGNVLPGTSRNYGDTTWATNVHDPNADFSDIVLRGPPPGTVQLRAALAAASAMHGDLHFAGGGPIRGGSKIRDDVLILGMDGEFMMKRDAVNYYGPKFMDDVNSKRLKRYASGGAIGTLSSSGGNGGDINITIPVTIPTSSSDTPQDVESKRKQAEALAPLLRAGVYDILQEQLRPGGALHRR
jgi:hypothetical protein